MCTGRCANCLGMTLIPLALVSIIVNVLLLFPNWEIKYIRENHIATEVTRMDGLWGGGLLVLMAACQMKSAGLTRSDCACCKTRVKMFVSILSSAVALVGAVFCFAMASTGLRHGPFCLINATSANGTQEEIWGYPFHRKRNLLFNDIGSSYLFNHTLWDSACLEPRNILPWNVTLFIILFSVSILEGLLVFLQMVNGFLGCLCGPCTTNKVTPV